MEKIKTGLYLDKDVLVQFRKLAKQEGILQNTLFEKMLNAYLREKENRKDEE